MVIFESGCAKYNGADGNANLQIELMMFVT